MTRRTYQEMSNRSDYHFQPTHCLAQAARCGRNQNQANSSIHHKDHFSFTGLSWWFFFPLSFFFSVTDKLWQTGVGCFHSDITHVSVLCVGCIFAFLSLQTFICALPHLIPPSEFTRGQPGRGIMQGRSVGEAQAGYSGRLCYFQFTMCASVRLYVCVLLT